MSRHFHRLSVLATVAVAPFAAGCGGQDRPAPTTTASADADTSAAQPTSAESGATTPTAGVTTPATTSAATSHADAETAFRRGRYADALDLFTAYTQSNPDNAWGHYMLGLSAWKTGDHERALQGFDEALRLEPAHRKSLLNSARVLLETSRPQEALNRVEQALAIEPLSGEGLRLLGRARHELGQVPEAIDAYQRAIALDDHDVWAMNNLGYIYIQQGRSDAALLPLARAVEIRSNVSVFQNNLATALERTGHIAAAQQSYQAALQADSTYTKASVGLARVSGRAEPSGTASVDLAALSREFQTEVEQWRTTSAPSDSAQAGRVARDSITQ